MKRIAIIFLLCSTSCAAKVGWTRGDRVCEDSDPPHVCFEAAPDAPLTLTVGDVRLVPNECAFAIQGERGGSLRVALEDGESGSADHRRIRVRKGKTTTVTATSKGMDVRRTACTSAR
jgi:hypothetical protein